MRRCSSILRLAYITTAWEVEYATCAKLINYPDTPWNERDASRLSPRSQRRCRRSLPTEDVHVPDPQRLRILATGDRLRHRSEHEVHLRANAQPQHGLAGPAVLREHRRRDGVHERAGARDHRHRRAGRHADDPIDRAAGGLPHLSRDAVHLCGADRPPARRATGAYPSAGPYYISSFTPDQHHDRVAQSELQRAPATALRRPRVRLQPERGDGLPTGPVRRTGRGPASGRPCPRGRRSVRPRQPRRGARASAVLRRAGQLRRLHAVEHRAPPLREPEHAQGGELRGRPHGVRGPGGAVRRRHRSISCLAPGMPGYEDIDVYPDHPDLALARDLAGWHPGDPLRPITVYYRSSGIDQPRAV